jgi:hypothetical protein
VSGASTGLGGSGITLRRLVIGALQSRSRVEWVETPTPDPYTPVLTDTEMDVEDVGTGAQTSMTTITSAYGCSSLTP